MNAYINLTVLTTSILLIGCSRSITENDLTKDKLMGSVKSVSIISYSKDFNATIEEGNWENFITGRSEISYNKSGNMTEKNVYDSDGNLTEKTVYQYDSSDNKIEENDYDSTHNLTGKRLYHYDANDNLIELDAFDADGNLIGRRFHKYDEHGNNVEWSNYTYGDLVGKYTFKYDQYGNRVEVNSYDPNDNLQQKTKYKYDEKGDNWVVAKLYGSDGSLIRTSNCEYDERGNLIAFHYNSEGSRSIFFDYTYDSLGNWTTMTKSLNEMVLPVQLERRKIEYYD